MNRLLGVHESGIQGPLLVLIGGVHGNESTGVKAIQKVFQSIKDHNIDIKGKLIGMLGNARAYSNGKRFHDYDLNRCWSNDFVKKITQNFDSSNFKVEDLEMLELYSLFMELSMSDNDIRIIADLHATSSDNGNFIVIPEDESNHPVVQALRLPVVIDIHKYLEGTLLEYMHKRGFVSFAFEGGLIGSQQALDMHTSGIWEIIYAAGMVERRHDHEFSEYDQLMNKFVHRLPHKVSVLYRHKIEKQDGFKMNPGYVNFQNVKKGEVIAFDRNGPIKVRENGLIFLPLYQDLGDDGFFIVKEIEGEL